MPSLPLRPIVCILLLICLAAGRAVAQRPYDVIDYSLSLRIDTAARTITGEVTVHLISRDDALRSIQLDAAGLDVHRVLVHGRNAEFRSDGTILTVALREALPRDTALHLVIAYGGRPAQGITFESGEIYTQFHTRRWLVCNDDPSDRATLSLALDIPAGLDIVATGTEVLPRSDSGGRTRSVWRLDRPYPPYLFGFAAGRFTMLEDAGARDTLRYMSARYDSDALEKIFRSTRPAVRFFSERAGIPLPGGTYSQVLVAGRAQQELAGMSAISAAYGDEVLDEPREDWLVVHELAHQWWGNLLTCASWSEIWLNEGFATYMTAAFKEAQWGRDEYDRELMMARLRYERLLRSGQDRPLRFTGWKGPEEANGPIPYYKGALVLHLLRYQLGEERFWKGIGIYTRRHAGEGVTGEDLRHALEEAGGTDLRPLFSRWVDGSGIPSLLCRFTQENGEVVVRIDQPHDPWPLSVRIAMETDSGREVRQVELGAGSVAERFKAAGRLRSVRIDDGGYLPFRVPYKRPLEMLLHQAVHEPDLAGRADALLEIETAAPGSSADDWNLIAPTLADREAGDPSRFIRALAGRIMGSLNKKREEGKYDESSRYPSR